MTFRYYIQDMAFACALAIPDDLSGEAAQGLQTPVWELCLGRKNCVPAAPVFGGLFDQESEALSVARRRAEKARTEIFRVVSGICEGGDAMVLRDEPLCFGLRKEYESRHVTLIPS